MEKHHGGKSGSFIGRHRKKTTSDHHGNSPRSTFSPKVQQKSTATTDHDNNIVTEDPDQSFDDHEDECMSDHDHDQISVDIDRFADALSMSEDKTTMPEVPDTVETFTRIIESRIRKYHSTKPSTRFGKMTEEDTFFIEAVRRLSKLKNAFGEFPDTSSSSSHTRTSIVLQRAMVFLEEELRALLEDSRAPPTPKPFTRVMTSKHSSFKADRCPAPVAPEPTKEDDFPGYKDEIVTRMNKIVTTMISAGFEHECCNVYSMARKNALYEQIKRLEFEKINTEDLQKIHWDSLEIDISRWVKIAKCCSNVLFPSEKKFGETVFSDHLPVFRALFINMAGSIITSLLEFPVAMATTKQSAERVFKFLDIYEALRDLNLAIKDSSFYDVEHSQELSSEISSATNSIGEGVANIFGDLENSIRNDASKTPVPGGAVHPLTRYIMNYIKYACEYKDTLEQIFEKHAEIGQQQTPPAHSEDDAEKKTPLSVQLLSLMDLLDGNLEAKSLLYKDLSLRYIFLMNNGRYILQKVKGSSEIHQLMGDNWCRKRSTEVRHYHKSYQRETWTKLLQCITQEGIQVNGKVNKQVLKERFKTFNAMFDEIHKAQSTWVVSEEQLVSELRVSISAVVIPAYRSFLGRYKQHLEGGRNADKYLKYQPDDIESLIETLFEGNAPSMGRKKS